MSDSLSEILKQDYSEESQQEEAQRLLNLHDGNLFSALKTVENQLNVLYTRAQVLLTLAGAAVTVTGFSGTAIAGDDGIRKALVIIGLFSVLASACWTWFRVMPVRWISNFAGRQSPEQDLLTAIKWRDRKSRAYSRGGSVLCFGLLLYASAFALLLVQS